MRERYEFQKKDFYILSPRNSSEQWRANLSLTQQFFISDAGFIKILAYE